MKFPKKIIFFILILFTTAFIAAFIIFLTPNISQEYNLFIDEEANYDSIAADLEEQSIIKSSLTFSLAATILNYEGENIRTGKFILKPNMTNFSIIRKLRSGRQDPVRVVVQNGRYLSDFISQLSSQLMIDSIEISDYLSHPDFLKENNITKEETLTLFIPNTYEYYWDSSLENVIDRLLAEGEKYWNESNRLEKINNLNLDKKQVYTLASIVEKESQNKEELATIAGLYLNRFKINMPLQADPTVVFALGNFELRRVFNNHLKIDSPYNTYKYTGLPPGPICMPSLNSLNAVINAENHNYIYMCAKPGYEGKHLFAETFNQHIINANKYRVWLEQEGIK